MQRNVVTGGREYIFRRLFCTSTSTNEPPPAKCSNDEKDAAKPFDSIPGPTGPFGIGTLHQYFPFVGKNISLMLFIIK